MFGIMCLCEVRLRRFGTENWISKPQYLLSLQEAAVTAVEAVEKAVEAAVTAVEAAENSEETVAGCRLDI